jgi:hypothetical protein
LSFTNSGERVFASADNNGTRQDVRCDGRCINEKEIDIAFSNHLGNKILSIDGNGHDDLRFTSGYVKRGGRFGSNARWKLLGDDFHVVIRASEWNWVHRWLGRGWIQRRLFCWS